MLNNPICSSTLIIKNRIKNRRVYIHILSIEQVLINPPKNGEEIVAFWQSKGVINSRPNITDSQVHARNLLHEAEMRIQQ